MKLARQYFLEKVPAEPQRTRFISRSQSYHGTTLGALSVGGHKGRRLNFEPLLANNVTSVSPCFAYRGKTTGERDDEYLERLLRELDDEFQRVGSANVCAFVAEPVVGAVGAQPGRLFAQADLEFRRPLAVSLQSTGTSRQFERSATSTGRF